MSLASCEVASIPDDASFWVHAVATATITPSRTDVFITGLLLRIVCL
jgi:hypothetical protein